MNSKNSLLLVDPDFDPANAAECVLLMRVTTDSFSYAIIDRNTRQLNAVYDYQQCDAPEAFSSRLKTDGYLAIPFKEVKASIFTESTIAIPDELYDASNLNDYAKFFAVEQSNNLYTQTVDDFGFKSIFTLSNKMDEALNSSLRNCRVFDQNAPVLAMAKHHAADSLLLDFTAGSFNAVYTRAGKLIFQKHFEVENSEEFNYYLLLIINQLKLRTAETAVFLTGIIHEDDAIYSCIAKYFKTINFTEAPAIDSDNRILDDMPAHYYSSLLALDLCG